MFEEEEKMSIKIIKGAEGICSFDTDDIGLATALSIKGYDIIYVHPIDCCCDIAFHFALASGIEEEAQNYWDGMMQIDPHEYWHEYQKLTAFIVGVMCDEN